MNELLAVDAAGWKKNAASVSKYYDEFGDTLPKELRSELDLLQNAKW